MKLTVCVFLTASTIHLFMFCVHSFERMTPYDASHGVQVSCIITSCGVKDEILQNSKVTYTPDPPQLGKNLTLTLTGNLIKQVTNGSTIEAGYSVNGVVKRIFTADFCEEITIVNLTCPLQPGPLRIIVVLYVPQIAQGSYGAFVNATDQNSDPLLCFKAVCLV